MSRLNQIVAVVNGKKTRAEKRRDEVYKNLQKPAPFSGILRTFHQDQEDGPTFPDETRYLEVQSAEARKLFHLYTNSVMEAQVYRPNAKSRCLHYY